jgi:hypothetical protein
MRLRPDIDKELKELFMEIIDSKRHAILQLGKRNYVSKFRMTVMILPKVLKFIDKLKTKVRVSLNARREKNTVLNQTKYLLLRDNETLVIKS